MVVFCHTGVRSGMVTQWLRQQGFDRAWNLQGGIDAWARTVDPTLRRY
jgi:rhodanese-related sulfurtransferase